MSALVFGPRKINMLRRVAIPRAIGKATGLTPGAWAVVSSHYRDQSVLVIRPVAADALGRNRSDPQRPRRISDSGQLTLPSVLMSYAGFTVGGWVAFAYGHRSVQVFAAQRVAGPTLGRL
ncbi:hypothetical protein DDT46_00555 [Mycobacteroides abscessus]|nr:hypothetical protein DDT46_00555 [Mycobacteroides abscessus]